MSDLFVLFMLIFKIKYDLFGLYSWTYVCYASVADEKRVDATQSTSTAPDARTDGTENQMKTTAPDTHIVPDTNADGTLSWGTYETNIPPDSHW